jgi:hypothetical protein
MGLFRRIYPREVPFSTEDICRVWDRFGLTIGLEGERKVQTAVYLDVAVKYSMQQGIDEEYCIVNYLLPIIRRIMNDRARLDVADVVHQLRHFYQFNMQERMLDYYNRSLIDHSITDPEAEVVAEFARFYSPTIFKPLKKLKV